MASFFDIYLSIVLILAMVGVSVIALSASKNKYLILAGFFILVFAGGMARFNVFNLERSNLVNLAGQDVTLSGFINSEPVIDGTKMRFSFRTQGDNVLVTTNAFPDRKFGEELHISGKLQLPENFSDFDYVTYLKKDGIRTIISFPRVSASKIDLTQSESFRISIYKSIYAIKNKFQNSINLSIPEPNASFINGILLGTRQNIPEDLKDAFSKTGTTHILAISGYNIMIISEAVLLGLIWFFKRRVAFWISVVIIILFVILTGASASVVRAAVMGLLLSFAHGYGRLYDQKNSIVLAGTIMIFINPLVLVFDIGFQLSFLAVIGLIYLYPYIDRKLYKVHELGGMKDLTLMTLSAQIAVAPLIIYYFGNFSVLSLPANILILPFVPVAMLAGFIAGLLGMLAPVTGQLVGYIAWAVTNYQIWIVEYFAGIV